jgi:hypothetical protein
VRLSNGLTATLLNLLAIAGCERAASEWERALVYWIVEHDQSCIGGGFAGFAVDDLGWTKEDFHNERRFVLAIIEAAMSPRGWERMPYTLTPDGNLIMRESLLRLHEMVSMLTAATEPGAKWTPSRQPIHGICDVHGVYLHEHGCIVCNN